MCTCDREDINRKPEPPFVTFSRNFIDEEPLAEEMRGGELRQADVMKLV